MNIKANFLKNGEEPIFNISFILSAAFSALFIVIIMIIAEINLGLKVILLILFVIITAISFDVVNDKEEGKQLFKEHLLFYLFIFIFIEIWAFIYAKEYGEVTIPLVVEEKVIVQENAPSKVKLYFYNLRNNKKQFDITLSTSDTYAVERWKTIDSMTTHIKYIPMFYFDVEKIYHRNKGEKDGN